MPYVFAAAAVILIVASIHSFITLRAPGGRLTATALLTAGVACAALTLSAWPQGSSPSSGKSQVARILLDNPMATTRDITGNLAQSEVVTSVEAKIAATASEHGVVTTDEMVNEQLSLLKRACCDNNDSAYRTWLTDHGTDEGAVRRSLTNAITASQVQASFISRQDGKYTDKQLRAALKRYRDSLTRRPERRVLIARSNTLSGIEAMRKKLTTDRTRRGREKVIRENSSDPTAPSGGRVTIPQPANPQLDPEPKITRAAFNTATGKVSQAVQTSTGDWVVVIPVSKRTPAFTNPTLGNSRKELTDLMNAERGINEWRDYINTLTEDGVITTQERELYLSPGR